jgi:hypothetical protein
MRLRPLAVVLCASLIACPGDDTGETAATTTGTTGTAPTSTGEPATSTAESGEVVTSSSSGTPADGTSTGGGPGLVEVCMATCEHLFV